MTVGNDAGVIVFCISKNECILCQPCLRQRIYNDSREFIIITTSVRFQIELELIHADTLGYMEEVSVGETKYFVLLKDDIEMNMKFNITGNGKVERGKIASF